MKWKIRNSRENYLKPFDIHEGYKDILSVKWGYAKGAGRNSHQPFLLCLCRITMKRFLQNAFSWALQLARPKVFRTDRFPWGEKLNVFGCNVWSGGQSCARSHLLPVRGVQPASLCLGCWPVAAVAASDRRAVHNVLSLFHCIIMLLICCPYRRTLIDSQCETPQIVCASALKVFGMASGTSVKVSVLVAVAMLTCIPRPSENWDPTLLVEIQVLNHGAVCRPKGRVLPLSFKKA